MMDNGNIILFIVSLIPVFILSFIYLKNSLHMAQQNSYNKDNHYLKWIGKDILEFYNSLKVYLILIVLLFIFGILNFINIIWFRYLLVISIILIIYLKKKELSSSVTKLKLNVTSRVKRLIATYSILYLIALTSSIILSIKHPYIAYFIILMFVLLTHFVMILTIYINKPVEKMVYNKFKKKAVDKLNSVPDLKVIGITGSFGKTSSKNILNEILNIKYNSLASPKSYNTPYGLIITVNDYLDKFDDILIAEMGARKEGEIKELCDLVKPKYGILTSIGEAHLESFGSIENICNTKFELIESLPEDGIGVLNIDDEHQLNYELKNNCQIITIGVNNKDADVLATDIKAKSDGTEFKVKFKGEKKKYTFKTQLLGVTNIYNILASLALAKEFGLTIEEMQKAVSRIKPIEHRLELKPAGNITFIDDAFNSNPVGSKTALDVLASMPEKRVIITPGMIELGEEQYNLNKEFGKYMKDKCDLVILVGKKQTKPILDGLEEVKFNQNKIHVVKDLQEGLAIVNKTYKDKKAYVLLENDLPDAFNEKE